MFRIILWQNFLISIIMIQFLSCDEDQDDQQLNQNDQQGDQSTNKRDPRYYCDNGFEFFCPIKKIRLVLHKIKKAVTPSGFHLPKFKMHNPFSGDSGDDKNMDNNQNYDPPKFDPPKYDPPAFQLHNPLADNSGGNNNT